MPADTPTDASTGRPNTTSPRTPAGAGRRRRSSGRRLVLVGVALALLGLAPTIWLRMSSFGRVHHAADAPSAPVTIVLGAGVWNGKPSPFLAARLDVARTLYDTGRTKVLLVSGDNRVENYDEPTAMRDYLIAHGVPAAAIVADFAGRDTYDTCVRAKKIFGVDRALIVSQAYHLPRAVGTCRAVGVDVQGVGDWSAKQYRETWRNGSLREIPAAWKTLLDVASGRDPVLGQPETAVTDALKR